MRSQHVAKTAVESAQPVIPQRARRRHGAAQALWGQGSQAYRWPRSRGRTQAKVGGGLLLDLVHRAAQLGRWGW